MKALLVEYTGEAWKPFEYFTINNQAIFVAKREEDLGGDKTVVIYRFKDHLYCSFKKDLEFIPIGESENIFRTHDEVKVRGDKYRVVCNIDVSQQFISQAYQLAESQKLCLVSKTFLAQESKKLLLETNSL